MKLHKYEDNEEDVFCDAPKPDSLPAGCKPSNQLNYFRQIIRAYQGRDEDAVKYVKKVKALIDKPLDDLELGHVRLAMAKVKCPGKVDIWVFCQLTRRLPHEDLGSLWDPRPRGPINYDDERLLIHFYDTFYNENIKLLGHTVRCRVNVLYHLLAKIGKEPNADLFQFMKGPSHQRTEEEIELVFDSLGLNDYPLCRAQPPSRAKPGPPVPAPALAYKVSLSPLTRNLCINQEKIKLQSIHSYLDF